MRLCATYAHRVKFKHEVGHENILTINMKANAPLILKRPSANATNNPCIRSEEILNLRAHCALCDVEEITADFEMWKQRGRIAARLYLLILLDNQTANRQSYHDHDRNHIHRTKCTSKWFEKMREQSSFLEEKNKKQKRQNEKMLTDRTLYQI